MKIILSYVAALFFASACWAEKCGQPNYKEILSRQPIGTRGLLAPVTEATPALKEHMHEADVLQWDVYIWPKTDEPTARAHDATITEANRQGFYILSSKAPNLETLADAQANPTFQELLGNGNRLVYFTFDKDPSQRRLQTVSPQDIESHFRPGSVNLITKFIESGRTFSMPAWTKPDQLRGYFDLDALWASKKTFKELMRQARKLSGEGYRFVFTKTLAEYKQALDVAVLTPRRGQDLSGSRFANPEKRTQAEQLFAEGKAFAVSVLSPTGQVEGGILVTRFGNLVDFDSTFYRNEDGILFSKLASLAFFSRLREQGVSRLSIDMVSAFSRSLKGIENAPVEWKEAVNSLRQREPIPFDFESDWRPQ